MKKHFTALRNRTFMISGTMILFWGFLILRLFSIQVLNSQHYRHKCKQQSVSRREIKPLRGTIYDRHGKHLTMDLIKYDFSVHPYLLDDQQALAKALSKDFTHDRAYYLNQFKTQPTFCWLERNIPEDKVAGIKDKYQSSNGLVLTRKTVRYYPYHEICGQVLGFTDPDNTQGMGGLELSLDHQLAGKPGWRIHRRDGLGRLVSRLDLPFQPALDGNDVTLTINIEHQTILHQELQTAYISSQAEKAMGILIDPQTGEIIAMVSFPPFNPNSPSKFPFSAQKNRVVTDIFEPGSTFKIVPATSAIESQRIAPGDTIQCGPGYIRVANRTIHDHKTYGALSFAEVIKNSSNVGTIKVAQQIGRENLFQYAVRYGFGNQSNIRFPGEENGILHPLHKWSELTLAQVAIGQGISCTALQLAYAYAAIANGGWLLKPRLIRNIQTQNGALIYRSKKEIIRQVADFRTMQTLREFLRLTVKSGTAMEANVYGMAIAGKTGTAQKVTPEGYSKTDYIATFVGFFPANQPKLLCAVILDNPKGDNHTGGAVCAPVVREVFKRIVNVSEDFFFEQKSSENKRIAQRDQTDNKVGILTASYVPQVIKDGDYPLRMPDLIGMTSRRAISILQRLGMQIKIEGSGRVISQYPYKGTIVKPDTRCSLVLRPKKES